MTLTITIPIPHRATHPNSRPHWASKAAHAKRQRTDAMLAAVSASRAVRFNGNLGAKYESKALFYFPTKRRRDHDNLIAWLKASFDGIADAKIVANDSLLVNPKAEIECDKTNPRVEITITPLS